MINGFRPNLSERMPDGITTRVEVSALAETRRPIVATEALNESAIYIEKREELMLDPTDCESPVANIFEKPFPTLSKCFTPHDSNSLHGLANQR